MTERIVTNASATQKEEFKVRLCPVCERIQLRSVEPEAKHAEQLIFAAVVYALASSRQVGDAMRALDDQALCDDANPFLVAIGRVVAALFEHFLLLGITTATFPWNVADVEVFLGQTFAEAGLESDFVAGRLATDCLASFRAAVMGTTRLN